MVQSIETKYLAPTNRRDARIVAKCRAKRITVAWDDVKDVEENHRFAAWALITALGWHGPGYGRWYGGAKFDGTGYTFVSATENSAL